MSTSPTFDPMNLPERQRPSIGINEVLAGIRMVESGSYQGNYGLVGPRFEGRTYFGAYQIATEYWEQWAMVAGISGANMSSPSAQDRVAAYVMGEYYLRFGDWNLAAMAWLAGPQEAAKVLRRGYGGVNSIQNPKIKEYVTNVATHAQWAAENPNAALTRQIPAANINYITPGSGWVHPVAGASEYSNSYNVPREITSYNKTGIHGAIDVYAKLGTPIVSPVAGTVISTKTGAIGGHTVRVRGDDGIIYYFAHMAERSVVSTGDKVMAGHHIGYVGASGNAKGTSPHLHLSMKQNGNTINPFSFLEKSSSMSVSQAPQENLSVQASNSRSGMTGTLNSWLQDMSDRVRAGALPEDVEELEEAMEERPADSSDQPEVI